MSVASNGHQATLAERITVDPDVCGGRPCIRGMRIRVSDILDMLGGGMSFDDILGDFEYLEEQDLKAALHYAATIVNGQLGRAA